MYIEGVNYVMMKGEGKKVTIPKKR